MNAAWVDRYLIGRSAKRPLDSMSDGTRAVDTTVGRIRVRVVGTGARKVVFVCDAPMVIEHYETLVELLRPEFRVICIELPGLGFSRPSPGFDFGVAANASAVREVLKAESVHDCILAFGCVGAYLAVLLAHEMPDVVRGVVLMQAPSWEDALTWARRIDFRGRGVLATPYLGQLVVAVARKRIAKRWIERTLGRSELASDFVRRTYDAFDAGSGWALASLTQGYFGGSAPLLHPIAQKAILVWGEKDRTHRSTDPRSGLAYLRNGELVRFDRAGHFPELEEPERFASLLHSF